MPEQLTLYLADDHPIVVDGLNEILKQNKSLCVMGIAHDGEKLIALLKHQLVDVVILDINMPRMNGIECTRYIKSAFPMVKVIILTMYPEKTFADQLMKAGADGCLLKSRGSKDLLDAIERVVSGKSYFDWISDFAIGNEQREYYRLSDREIEIIKLITAGKTSHDISEALFISEETVKTHRKNIFKKLDIHNVAELVTFAMNNKLI